MAAKGRWKGDNGTAGGRQRDGGRSGIACILNIFRDGFVLIYDSSFHDFGVPVDLVGSVLLVNLCIHALRVNGNGIYNKSLIAESCLIEPTPRRDRMTSICPRATNMRSTDDKGRDASVDLNRGETQKRPRCTAGIQQPSRRYPWVLTRATDKANDAMTKTTSVFRKTARRLRHSPRSSTTWS